MDIESCLAELLRLASNVRAVQDGVDPDDGYTTDEVCAQASSAERMAELVHAAHEWLSKGGALPKEWSR